MVLQEYNADRPPVDADTTPHVGNRQPEKA